MKRFISQQRDYIDTIYNLSFTLPTLVEEVYSQIIDGYWKNDGDMLTIGNHIMVNSIDIDGIGHPFSNDKTIIELLSAGDKKISLVVDSISITSKMEGCPNGLKDFTLDELKQHPTMITVSVSHADTIPLVTHYQPNLFSLESIDLPPDGGDVVIGNSLGPIEGTDETGGTDKPKGTVKKMLSILYIGIGVSFLIASLLLLKILGGKSYGPGRKE